MGMEIFSQHSLLPLNPDYQGGYHAQCSLCGHKFRLDTESDREIAATGICFVSKPAPEYGTLQLVGGGRITIKLKE